MELFEIPDSVMKDLAAFDIQPEKQDYKFLESDLIDYSLHYPIDLHTTTCWLDSTKLDSFQRCPRFYFLKYVLGFNGEGRSQHLEIGQAWHTMMEKLRLASSAIVTSEVMEAFYKEVPAKQPDDAAILAVAKNKKLADIVKAGMGVAYENISPEQWAKMGAYPKIPQRLPLALLSYILKWETDSEKYEIAKLGGEDGVEVGGHFYFSTSFGSVPIKFRWDAYLYDYRHGVNVIREIKTASSIRNPEEEWLTKIQPGTYTVAERLLKGVDPANPCHIQMDITCFKKLQVGQKADATNPFRHIEHAQAMLTMTLDQHMIWSAEVSDILYRMRASFDALSQASVDDKIMYAFPMCRQTCNFQFGRPCQFRDVCTVDANPLRMLDEVGVPSGFTQEFWDPDHKPTQVRIEVPKESKDGTVVAP